MRVPGLPGLPGGRRRGVRTGPGVWPVVLERDDVRLRPLRVTDGPAWHEARRRNAAWLVRWDATVPPGADPRPTSFETLARGLLVQARQGRTYPFVVEVDGVLAGQVSINNVVRGSAQFASVGYWLDQRFAGRGVMPRAVAMAIDHALGPLDLHRIEVAIRPENSNSLRVVEKLGIAEYGYAPRFLHIDGDWRDHRLFAVTREDLPPEGLLARLLASPGWDRSAAPESQESQ